ncbi:hypothetical protein NP493_427g02017 [Ridgeia piscesae]|uniref:GRAM domain-containing protein n=1 Tax=Ridgeia piscesae TaxID=27915 RepID=A0AAD9KZW1_RIDPI|nr:hypothetical protein NP493_427g02017 [Ridgeia piscesae]
MTRDLTWDHLTHRKSRSRKFHKVFKNIPAEEEVIKSCSCAFFGDILLQGYLYISPHWFCFYTKILGHQKLIQIPVNKVLNIMRQRTAFIIPNAIGVVTAQDKYVFGSLLSRDSTYKLMCSVWQKNYVEVEPEPKSVDVALGESDTNAISLAESECVVVATDQLAESEEISLAESSNDGSQLVQMMPVIKVTPDTSLDSSDTFSFGSTDINQSTCDIFFETSSIIGGPPTRKPSVEMETPLTHSRLKSTHVAPDSMSSLPRMDNGCLASLDQPSLSTSLDQSLSASCDQSLSASLDQPSLSASLDQPSLSASLDQPSMSASLDQSLSASLDQSLSASYDQSLSASCDQSLSVSSDQSLYASCDQSLSASCDQSLSASSDQSLSASCDQSLSASSDQSLSASCDQSLSASSDQSLYASCDQPLSASCDQSLSASSDQSLSASCDQSLSASCDQPLSASSDQSLYASCDQSLSASCDQSLSASCDQSLYASCDQSLSASCDQSLSASCDQPLSASCVQPLSASCDQPPYRLPLQWLFEDNSYRCHGFRFLFLLMCAAMLSYKIVLLQARIEGNLDWVEPSSQHLTQNSCGLHNGMYRLSQQQHAASVAKLHSVLEANIHTLHNRTNTIKCSSCESSSSASQASTLSEMKEITS